MSSITSAIAFFTYGMVICGALLAYFGLAPRFELASFAIVLAASFIVAIAVFHKLIPRPAREVRPSREGLRWSASFIAGFTVAYTATWVLARINPCYAVLPSTAWYLGLALSFLAVHFTWEKWFVERRIMIAPAFLVAGLLMLATYPIAAWATLIRGPDLGNIAATGLTLLCYFCSGAYALLKANEALLARKERVEL